MPLTTPRTWLIAYDIAEPRRLSRLHRYLVKHAVPVQNSVFYCEATSAQMGRLIKALARLVDSDFDDVRAYQLPERLDVFVMGRGSLPDGCLVSHRGPALTVLTSGSND